MRAALACLALGSLVACGGGGGNTAAPKRPVGPAIEPEEARQGASDLVTEIYETLGRGNKDSLFTLLEDSLMVFGPRGPDMLGTRADALVALGQVVDPKAKKNLAIRSSKIDVVTAPRGHSAVVFDSATINGQPHTILAVLTNTNDLWLVGAVAVAHTPAAPQLKAELAKDAVVPPGAVGAKKVDPAARAAVERFQRGLLDQAAWGDDLTSHPDSIVVGPTTGEVARGKQEIRELWKKRLDARTRAAVAGEITAAVTGDGQLAWVSAPITRVEGEGAQPLPLRAFAVFERAGDAWSLVALNESLAFSEPGAGAPFKRFLPPKPAEPKPAEPKPAEPKQEVIADRPKDKDKAKDKGKEPEKVTAKAEPPKKKQQPDADGGEEPRKKVKAKESKQALARSEVDGDDARSEEPKKKGKPVKAKEKAKANEINEATEASETPRKKKRTFAQSMGDESSESGEAPAKAEDAAKKKTKKSAKTEEAEEAPKKAKKTAKAEEEADEAPKKKVKKAAKADEEAEEAPKKAKKTAKAEEAADEAPKKKVKKAAKADEEGEEGKDAPKDAPKKKTKKAAKADEEAEESPKKATKAKAKPKADEAEEAPKKKPAPADDDDEIEVID